MITVAEIRKKAEGIYYEYLKSVITGEVFFPRTIRSNKSVSDDFNVMRVQLAELIEHSKDRKFFGYSISYKKVNTRKHGLQSFPEEISFQTEEDFLKFLNKEREVFFFKLNSDKIISEFPELKTWITTFPNKVIENAKNWDSLLVVCHYFKDEPKPNLYIRELPIKVHTKFVESCKGILHDLLTLILPIAKINPQYTSVKDFEKRFGLKYNQSRVRIRILDKVISEKYLSGITDIEITEDEFNNLQIPCKRVFILENKTNFSNLMNFLTLPQMEGTIGIFGAGFRVGNLKAASWLNQKEIYYWGDIDSHGIQILSQIRGYFKHTKSIMMDFRTLNAFKEDWCRGEITTVNTLPYLNKEEEELFNFLKGQNLKPIRLEQEKISHDFVLKELEQLLHGNFKYS